MQASEIEGLKLFQQLSAQGRAWLDEGLRYLACPASTLALRKGQVVSGAYVVLPGRLRVFTLAPKGVEATLYFLGPGETCVLALNSLFNDLLYPAWVQAESTARIGLIPGPLYRKLFEAEPAIRNMTVQTLSSLVFRLMSELEQVHTQPHRQRLANFLLVQSSTAGVLCMTQQQLAHHLGATREGIARLLADFAAQGWISTGRGRIVIRDPHALRQLLALDQ